MQLIIGGDLVPTQSNIDLFSNGDVNALFGEELLSLWNAADLHILNLEVPITDKEDSYCQVRAKPYCSNEHNERDKGA